MTIYYKATRPDGTDFRTGTVLYEVGQTVTHPVARRERDNPATYLSVSTAPTDCTGFQWPCRLFVVEGHGRPLRTDGLPNKRCFSSLTVVEERPAWEAFGPQGEDVVGVIERAKTLTASEVRVLKDAWSTPWTSAWDAAWDAARAAAREAARTAAWTAAWDAAWTAARSRAREAARTAVWGHLTRDLISTEHFELLAGPWREVIR